MAADGEVEIAVRAEGADEAADEFAEGAETDTGGGGGADAAGIGKSLKSIVKLLGVITAVTKALEPLLEFVEAIFELNAAFWAPVATMLLRLFRPVLRFWLKILPVWYDFLNNAGPRLDAIAEWIRGIPGRIRTFLRASAASIREKVSEVVEKLTSLPRRIWELIKDLPRMIAERISGALPGTSDIGGAVGDTGRGAVERGVEFAEDKTNINISGGLETFVDRVEKESGLSFP